MLVIRHKRSILLQKRPPSGIWGGLWSLPQVDIESEPGLACHALTGFPPARIDALPAFTHVLTHLRLHIEPREILLDHRARADTAAGGTWMHLQDALGAAVPRPVSRILQSLGPA
jgi:A/G-specific adenine glycosylase